MQKFYNAKPLSNENYNEYIKYLNNIEADSRGKIPFDVYSQEKVIRKFFEIYENKEYNDEIRELVNKFNETNDKSEKKKLIDKICKILPNKALPYTFINY